MSIAEIRRTITPDGTSLAWRAAGPPGAPWLVLCNGAGCSEEYWTASFLPVAARRMRVLWWDYRGHHESKPSPDPQRYRVENHAVLGTFDFGYLSFLCLEREVLVNYADTA